MATVLRTPPFRALSAPRLSNISSKTPKPSCISFTQRNTKTSCLSSLWLSDRKPFRFVRLVPFASQEENGTETELEAAQTPEEEKAQAQQPQPEILVLEGEEEAEWEEWSLEEELSGKALKGEEEEELSDKALEGEEEEELYDQVRELAESMKREWAEELKEEEELKRELKELQGEEEEEEGEEDEHYEDRIESYKKETGLTDAVQTGIGKINGIPVAFGVMEFQFVGGSMGAVVGEKITRLIEYATDQFLPLILVCSSGGARMQEGSYSLMQMAKISSALHNYRQQSKKNHKLFYVTILASPTTGGVIASFGMLGDIIIAEPNATIAFAGARVIEQTLKVPVPEDAQEAEPLFEKGLFDLLVPRNLLKGVLTHLLELHGFFPLNQNETDTSVDLNLSRQ
uniref:Acetyl-CoA carboxylase subunit beta n=1 Tax=Hypseocharis bilobata TaxID=253189 RepID=A0A286SC53_9ROSI|nr:acetyl-CoA carboxylase subunit beta [Hypseocharis bilobata]